MLQKSKPHCLIEKDGYLSYSGSLSGNAKDTWCGSNQGGLVVAVHERDNIF